MTEITKEVLTELLEEHGSLRRVSAYLKECVDAFELTDIKPPSHQALSRLAKKFGINPRKVPRESEKNRDSEKPTATGEIESPESRRRALSGSRFVFTSAQNNTLIHEGFWGALCNFCAHNDAELIVSPFTYNKSGFQNGAGEDLWYDERLKPHFVDHSVIVAKNLIFCGELNILPTATNPMSGFGNYTQNSSGIIPHAKVQMESMPRMKFDEPRFMYTTGAVTLRNYIAQKAGQKADFHHVFGALYVEVDDEGTWFARQLIADNTGKFYDLTDLYTPDSIIPNQNVLAINYGDIHVEKLDEEVALATWFKEHSLANVLKPKYQFMHDISDFSARNHHNIKDPKFLAETLAKGTNNVRVDIENAGILLDEIESYADLTIVVESNHDKAFERWLKEADIRTDPVNAEFYYLCNYHMYKNITDKTFNIHEWAIRKFVTLEKTIFIREDDSFVIGGENGIECGMHGHLGPNGRRGAPNAFRNIGKKVNIGHAHSASIIDGVYTAGVSCKLDMGYNKGPSSWSHSHIVTYPNGKRAIITIKDGKWQAQN